MTRIALVIALAILTAAAITSADPAVEGALQVYQIDSANRPVLLSSDTVRLVDSIRAVGFVGPLSVDLMLTDLDSSAVTVEIHAISLGASAATRAKTFRVEYGLPARLSEITVKDNARYLLEFVPLRPAEFNRSACDFPHNQDGAYSSSPSAYMDIFYVPESLGDFYWNSVKDLLEESYRRFRTWRQFNLPGKVSVYLCPCFVPSVLWDDRFGMMIDPVRNIAFAVYSKELTTLDPYVVIYPSVMRTYGYAPPLLAEGLSGYFSFAAFDMKTILAEDRPPALATLTSSRDYLAMEPALADRSAATFVQYLIEAHGFAEFEKAYRAADDLNLGAVLEKTYGKPLPALEQEWRTFVDTLTIAHDAYRRFAVISEQLLNYPLMREYARAAVDHAADRADSIESWGIYSRACFFTGNYYDAAMVQQALVQLEPTKSTHRMAQAAYQMMIGELDQAGTNLERACASDSTSGVIRFNMAQNLLARNMPDSARLLLERAIGVDSVTGAQLELRILLGTIIQQHGDSAEQGQAAHYFQEALPGMEQAMQLRNSPAAYMWAGICHYGLKDYPMALDRLLFAEFLETRPFYSGMIHLWLGKTFLALNDPESARHHLASVIGGLASVPDQREAEALLATIE